MRKQIAPQQRADTLRSTRGEVLADQRANKARKAQQNDDAAATQHVALIAR
ncbi:hypothetical protein SDC9_96640 [bioreactor metagenome]|uniref:Uncharacterized protein n=1 Tax=bioreactor metagenome TaxID=1076179 RepID=A0A645AAG0_9ZZZZ